MINCQTPQPQWWTLQSPEMDFAFKWELTNQRSLLHCSDLKCCFGGSKHSHSLPGELGNFWYTSESLIHKEMLSNEPAVTFCSRRQTSVHDDIVLFTTKNFLMQGSTVDFFSERLGVLLIEGGWYSFRLEGKKKLGIYLAWRQGGMGWSYLHFVWRDDPTYLFDCRL